jgi:hypothetical protein
MANFSYNVTKQRWYSLPVPRCCRVGILQEAKWECRQTMDVADIAASCTLIITYV